MSEHPLALKIKSEDGYNFTPGIAETPNSGLKDGNNFISAIADTPNSGLSVLLYDFTLTLSKIGVKSTSLTLSLIDWSLV